VGIAATGNISTTGNISGGNFIGSIAGTSSSLTGNLNANNVIATTIVNGASFTGGLVSVTGQITGSQFNGSGAGLTSIPGANVTGTVPNATTAVVAGTVTTAAQGNITSVGTLTTLTVSGTASVTGNVSTGGKFVGNGSALTSTMTDRGTDQNDWNTLIQMGVYTVNRVSWSGTTGAPLDSQVFVGLLEVKNSTDTSIEQIFFPGTIESGDIKIQWNRANWNGTWTPWIKIVNNDQIVTGGSY
jgi:hypothetical protein